jgi:predicted AAA+ superfamily ATPase
LCGSSARKLKRSGANLLGGRAIRYILHPLVSAEIPDFDLIKAINNGLLPRHYLIDNPIKRLQSYVGDYLQQEIRAEALIRNINSFTRFLEVAALTSSEMLNYQNIAAECGVSSPTVKEYFSILEDTMVGYIIPAYSKTKKRRLITAPKFYFFDVGITNYLLNRKSLQQGSIEFGKAFEHLIVQELVAFLSYTGNENKLSYWRTASQFEVDCILGDAETAIEIKSTSEVHPHHCKGLKAFKEEYPKARALVVSFDKMPRNLGDIEVLPAGLFLEKLWKGEIV